MSPALNFSTTVDLFGIISVSAGSGEGIHLLHPTHSNRDGLRPRFAVAWIRICMYVIFAHGDHPKEEVLPYGQIVRRPLKAAKPIPRILPLDVINDIKIGNRSQ